MIKMEGEKEGAEGGEEMVTLVSVISACKTWLSMVITFSTQRQQRKPILALLLYTHAAQSWKKHPVFVYLPATVSC